MKARIVALMILLVLGGCGQDGGAVNSQPHRGDYWFNPGPVCQAGPIYVYAENGKLFVNDVEQKPGDCYYKSFKDKYLSVIAH